MKRMGKSLSVMAACVCASLLLIACGSGANKAADGTEGSEIVTDGTEAREAATDGNAATRYEWVEMLAERFGMTEYEASEPHCEDVPENSPYFTSVQSVYEWGVLPENEKFDGDTAADGEYVALTAMKAIGKYKVQIYLGLDHEPEDAEYLSLAKEKELVPEDAYRRGMTAEECEAALEKAVTLSEEDLWVDDYEQVEYREDVVQLSEDDMVSAEVGADAIVVTPDVADSLEPGDKLVYPVLSSQTLACGEVVSVEGSGEIMLRQTELDDYVEKAVVSEAYQLTEEDILAGLMQIEGATVALADDAEFAPRGEPGGLRFASTGDKKSYSNHMKMGVRLDKNGLNLMVGTQTVTIPKNMGISGDEWVDATVDMGLSLSMQMVKDKSIWVDYADVQLAQDMAFEGQLQLHNYYPITLYEMNVPPTLGILMAEIKISLIIDVDGTFKWVISDSKTTTFRYQDGHCTQTVTPHNVGSSVEASVALSLYLEAEVKPKFLGISIVDLELGGGAKGEASIIARADSDIAICEDLKLEAPVGYFKVSAETEDDWTFVKDVLHYSCWIAFEDEYDWYRENVLQTWELHIETYKDGTVQSVPECTYGKNAEESEPEEASSGDLSTSMDGDILTISGLSRYGKCCVEITDYDMAQSVLELNNQLDHYYDWTTEELFFPAGDTLRVRVPADLPYWDINIWTDTEAEESPYNDAVINRLGDFHEVSDEDYDLVPEVWIYYSAESGGLQVQGPDDWN